MKHKETLTHNFLPHHHQPLSLSDVQIINLQRVFSTPGFHTLAVSSKTEEHAIVTTMLQSLKCYTNVACLTMPNESTQQLPDHIFDLFYTLALNGYMFGNIENKMSSFFLDELECDFLWIEACDKLIEQPWYYAFEQKVVDFTLFKDIPVVKTIVQ